MRSSDFSSNLNVSNIVGRWQEGKRLTSDEKVELGKAITFEKGAVQFFAKKAHRIPFSKNLRASKGMQRTFYKHVATKWLKQQKIPPKANDCLGEPSKSTRTDLSRGISAANGVSLGEGAERRLQLMERGADLLEQMQEYGDSFGWIPDDVAPKVGWARECMRIGILDNDALRADLGKTPSKLMASSSGAERLVALGRMAEMREKASFMSDDEFARQVFVGAPTDKAFYDRSEFWLDNLEYNICQRPLNESVEHAMGMIGDMPRLGFSERRALNELCEKFLKGFNKPVIQERSTERLPRGASRFEGVGMDLKVNLEPLQELSRDPRFRNFEDKKEFQSALAAELEPYVNGDVEFTIESPLAIHDAVRARLFPESDEELAA